eukprot:1321195-Pleurochrysis_carterae.AAC.1
MRVARPVWLEGPRGDATPGGTRSGRLPTPPDCRNPLSTPFLINTYSCPPYSRPWWLWPSFPLPVVHIQLSRQGLVPSFFARLYVG